MILNKISVYSDTTLSRAVPNGICKEKRRCAVKKNLRKWVVFRYRYLDNLSKDEKESIAFMPQNKHSERSAMAMANGNFAKLWFQAFESSIFQIPKLVNNFGKVQKIFGDFVHFYWPSSIFKQCIRPYSRALQGKWIAVFSSIVSSKNVASVILLGGVISIQFNVYTFSLFNVRWDCIFYLEQNTYITLAKLHCPAKLMMNDV